MSYIKNKVRHYWCYNKILFTKICKTSDGQVICCLLFFLWKPHKKKLNNAQANFYEYKQFINTLKKTMISPSDTIIKYQKEKNGAIQISL